MNVKFLLLIAAVIAIAAVLYFVFSQGPILGSSSAESANDVVPRIISLYTDPEPPLSEGQTVLFCAQVSRPDMIAGIDFLIGEDAYSVDPINIDRSKSLYCQQVEGIVAGEYDFRVVVSDRNGYQASGVYGLTVAR
jgi:hypothetical protein